MISHYLSFGLWLVGTAAMAVWTRHRGVSFCWGFVFGRGLVYYWSAKDGLPEFGGLLHQVWFGLGGWVMAYEVQRRLRRSEIASAPLTYFSTQSRDQWLRFLTACLLCSGLAWGLTIELLVLPSGAMFADLQHWSVNLQQSPVVEYSLRMVGITFTAIAFVYFVVAADLEKYFCVVPLLGLFMGLVGVTLLGFGQGIEGLDERRWIDGLCCLTLGVGTILLWLGCRARLRAWRN